VRDLDKCFGCGSSDVTWHAPDTGYAACESCASAMGIIRRSMTVEAWDALTDTERRVWYLKYGPPPHWPKEDPFQRRSPSP
jgi:hypothetical protein